MPKQRKPERADWPKYLYDNGEGGYYYKHPSMPSRQTLPRNLDKAKAIAHAANIHFDSTNGIITLEKITSSNKLKKSSKTKLADLLPEYLHYSKGKSSSHNTHKNLEHQIKTIQSSKLADMEINAIEIPDLMLFLDEQTGTMQNKFRTRLRDIFKFGLGRGIRQHLLGNPAEHILKFTDPDKQRERITLKEYRIIHDAAVAPLKTAMEIILVTTLRPCDVTQLTTDNYLPATGTRPARLRSVIRKSIRKGKPEKTKYLEFQLNEREEKVILDAITQGPPSPYIVKRHQYSRGPESKKTDHWSQFTVEALGELFNATATRCGLYLDLAPGVRPTLMEVRSLGSFLYKLTDRPIEEIQELMAHSNSKTTQIYLDGHTPYIPIQAGLDLSKLDDL